MGDTFVLIGHDEKFGEIYARCEEGMLIPSVARDGEPCFVIRGRDALAPGAIDSYADHANTNDLRNIGERVEGVAYRVQNWQRENHGFVHNPN